MPEHDEHADLGAVLAGDPAPDDGYASRAERRAAREHHVRRRKRRGRRGGVLVISLLVVALGAFGAYVGLKPLVASFTASDDYSGQGSGEVTVTIPDGATGREIGRTLEKADV